MCENCPDHLVDNTNVKESTKEKYLGDYLTSKANSKDTIHDKKSRGYGILAQMSAILQDIPLGNKKKQKLV